MRKIRVLVANGPRLMRELVLATVADQSDIDIVGEAERESEITELVERTRPDVLIISLKEREDMSVLCGFLLGRHPEMKIIGVAAHENSTVYYWAFVDIRSKQLETSEQGILAAIRNPSETLKSAISTVE